MAITSNIKQNIDLALESGSFTQTFRDELTAEDEYQFFLKVMQELGHDMSIKKQLLSNTQVTSNVLGHVSSLRHNIISNDVFRSLIYAKTTIELLQKV